MSARACDAAMIRLDESSLEHRVRQAVGQLVEGADKLRELGELLGEFGSLPASATPADLRQVVTGVQAAAMQALLTAANAVGLSERLSTIAHVREAAQADGG